MCYNTIWIIDKNGCTMSIKNLGCAKRKKGEMKINFIQTESNVS